MKSWRYSPFVITCRFGARCKRQPGVDHPEAGDVDLPTRRHHDRHGRDRRAPTPSSAAAPTTRTSPAATTTGTPRSAATLHHRRRQADGDTPPRRGAGRARCTRARRGSGAPRRPRPAHPSGSTRPRRATGNRRGPAASARCVVRRAEVVLERPARRRDQALDADRGGRRDHVGAARGPARNRLAPAIDEGVDDHAGTFSSRAALPPRTSASSAADKPA